MAIIHGSVVKSYSEVITDRHSRQFLRSGTDVLLRIAGAAHTTLHPARTLG